MAAITSFSVRAGWIYIVINLEYKIELKTPPVELLDWADNLLKIYNDLRAIMVTHYILQTDASFGLWGKSTYDALKDNPNLFLMLSGR